MHRITFAFSQCFMHFRCVFYMLKSCVLVGLDWAEPMMFLLFHVTCSCIFHAYVPHFSILLILTMFNTLLLVSLSLSLSLFLSVSLLMASKSKSTLFRNPLRCRDLLLILRLLMLGSVMIKPVWTFRRTFLDATFIRNAKSSFRIFPILTFPLSLTVGVGSSFVTSGSLDPPWSYRSFTPICTDLIT